MCKSLEEPFTIQDLRDDFGKESGADVNKSIDLLGYIEYLEARILNSLNGWETVKKANIEFHNQIIKSEKDAEIFFGAIVNPPKPNEALKKAAKEFLDNE